MKGLQMIKRLDLLWGDIMDLAGENLAGYHHNKKTRFYVGKLFLIDHWPAWYILD